MMSGCPGLMPFLGADKMELDALAAKVVHAAVNLVEGRRAQGIDAAKRDPPARAASLVGRA